MSVKINYKNLIINFNSWLDVPKIDKLTDEMNANYFKWWETNWQSYLMDNYLLDIVVWYLVGKLQFVNSKDMQLFILHFL